MGVGRRRNDARSFAMLPKGRCQGLQPRGQCGDLTGTQVTHSTTSARPNFNCQMFPWPGSVGLVTARISALISGEKVLGIPYRPPCAARHVLIYRGLLFFARPSKWA